MLAKSMLDKAKDQFLAKLAALGIQDEMVVAGVRRSRKNMVGYYCATSQFRSMLRIVVDVELIKDQYQLEADAQEEVLMTVANCYGHSMLEAIGHASFAVPDWKPVFAANANEFAEDFARFIVQGSANHQPFWLDFVPRYTAEYQRFFM